MHPPAATRPKVVLFDIGGVCVISPFRAILDYELANSIPPGWINHSISASGPTGSWARLERGEIPLDATFFRAFQQDLSNESRWRTYYARHLAKTRGESQSAGAEEALFQAPPVPAIDAEWLYWAMMRISRTPDPHMYPALRKLRRHADAINRRSAQSQGEGAGEHQGLVIAALSNTSIFPPDHPFNDPSTPDGKLHAELRASFDLFVSSAHVGMRKPDREIYDYALRELDRVAREKGIAGGVKAADVVFLDDIGANLKTARAVGMRTIKVTLEQTERAVQELEAVVGLELKGDKLEEGRAAEKAKL